MLYLISGNGESAQFDETRYNRDMCGRLENCRVLRRIVVLYSAFKLCIVYCIAGMLALIVAADSVNCDLEMVELGEFVVGAEPSCWNTSMLMKLETNSSNVTEP